MKTIMLGGILPSPAISLGCMRIAGMPVNEGARLLDAAYESGVTLFDHADIYGAGKSESSFASFLKHSSLSRDGYLVQIKCGIREGFFDFSREHIISSAESSLKRLGMDYADILLLHRPDTLMEPEEVAEAFTRLNESGKVRYFGVSNQNPAQMRLLKKYVKQPLIINQLQFSLTNTGMIDSGLNVNMKNPPSVDRDGGLLEYCRLHDITIQAWSPFQYGFFEGTFIDSPKYPALNQKLKELARKYDTDSQAIAIAWILRHPARIQPIIGTTRPERVRAAAKAYGVDLTREEWYALYTSAGNILP